MKAREIEAQAWFKQSDRDLNVAESLHFSGYYSSAVFHCQQAVEFALKGLWILLRETNPPHVHTLSRLGNQLGAPDQFENLFDVLTIAYLDSRYPGSSAEDLDKIYGEELSSNSLTETKEFMKWMRSTQAKTSENS